MATRGLRLEAGFAGGLPVRRFAAIYSNHREAALRRDVEAVLSQRQDAALGR